MAKQKADKGLDFLFECALADRDSRRLLADKSLRFFTNYYLERDLWTCQEDWAKQLKRIKFGGIIAPPGHGKTELTARFMALDQIRRNRDIRIICVSATDSLAKANGGLLREDLENPRLVEDFGSFKVKGVVRRKWTDEVFTVRRKQRMKDPTFRGVGIGGAVTGHRCDLMIFDDIVDELKVRNPDVREHTWKYVEGTLIPRLEPWGILWILGTRKHKLDVYSRFLSDPRFHMIFSKALIREPENYEFVEFPEPEIDENGYEVRYKCVIGKGDPGEALNRNVWPVDKLLVKRKSNSIIFNREYQGEVVDDESALIKKAWLDAAKDEDFSYGMYNRDDYVVIITAVDPSLTIDKKAAEKRDTDYTAVITIGVRARDHHFDLLGLYRDRGLSPRQIERAIITEVRIHQPDFGLVETNSFGTIIHWNLVDKNKTGVPWGKHLTGGKGARKYDPYEGYPTLSMDYENGLWRLPYKTDEDQRKTDSLINELYNPEDATHDDQLSGKWIARCGARRWLRVHGQTKKLRTEKAEKVKKPSGLKKITGF